MEQIVTVKTVHPDGTAEVLCRRVSACSGNCDRCGGCQEGTPQTVSVLAWNPIGAGPGDRVVVSSESGKVLGAAAAVYLVPLLLMLPGIFLAGAWGGLGGFVLGLGLAVLADRRFRRTGPGYTITAFASGV